MLKVLLLLVLLLQELVLMQLVHSGRVMVMMMMVVVIAYPRRVAWSAFLLDSVPVHANFETLFQPTAAALVAPGLVDWTRVVVRFAPITPVSSNRALEEAGAAVARVNAVMFARRVVGANFARGIK